MKSFGKFSISFFLALIFAIPAYGATGFVDAPIWFYPENPADGDTVTVQAVFRNDEKNLLTGSVLFYDNDLLLGKKSITIAPQNIALASVSFKIGPGNHSFSAQMSSLSESQNGGQTVPIALPIEVAKSPSYFVSKSIPNPFSAQAKGGSDASEQALLKQVDDIQNKVLESVPAEIKERVSSSAKSLDTWRDDSADNLTEKKDIAKEKLENLQKQNSKTETAKTVSPSSKYIDTPFAYVKFWIYSMLAFVFATPVMFYIVGLLFVFFVLRFIFGKIFRFIQKKKGKPVEN